MLPSPLTGRKFCSDNKEIGVVSWRHSFELRGGTLEEDADKVDEGDAVKVDECDADKVEEVDFS